MAAGQQGQVAVSALHDLIPQQPVEESAVIAGLRADLLKAKDQLLKAHDDIRGKNATIDTLLQELESLQAKQQDIHLAQKLQQSERQVQVLTSQLAEAQAEVSSLRQEVQRLKCLLHLCCSSSD